MWYVDERHEERTKELCRIFKIEPDPGDLLAVALWVLATLDKPIERFIRYDEEIAVEVDFDRLMEAMGPWSGTEKSRVRLAAWIVSSHEYMMGDVLDVSYDAMNSEVALQAVEWAYAGKSRRFFASREHSHQYDHLQRKWGLTEDRRLQAVLYLLAALSRPEVVTRAMEGGVINFDRLLSEHVPLGKGERALALMAASIYDSRWKVDIDSAMTAMDQKQRRVALEALRMYYIL